MHQIEISNYPTVSVTKFSRVHNAFFEHVAAYFVNLDIGFNVHSFVEDQMWQVEIKVGSKSFIGKEYDLPLAGLLAAISALQKIKKG